MEKIKATLRKLLELKVENKADLARWNNLAHLVYEEQKRSDIELPEVVWHYLSDADVRFKEPEYGVHQVEGVRKFVDE